MTGVAGTGTSSGGGRKIDPDIHTDLGMAQARQAEIASSRNSIKMGDAPTERVFVEASVDSSFSPVATVSIRLRKRIRRATGLVPRQGGGRNTPELRGYSRLKGKWIYRLGRCEKGPGKRQIAAVSAQWALREQSELPSTQGTSFPARLPVKAGRVSQLEIIRGVDRRHAPCRKWEVAGIPR